MPFNGEGNLEGCVIQHLHRRKFKLPVVMWQNFHRTIVSGITCGPGYACVFRSFHSGQRRLRARSRLVPINTPRGSCPPHGEGGEEEVAPWEWEVVKEENTGEKRVCLHLRENSRLLKCWGLPCFRRDMLVQWRLFSWVHIGKSVPTG